MHIEDLLSASDVVVDFAARDKADLLRAPAARAASVFKLSSDAVADTMQRRDELGSTGIGNGVSIPHARLRELKKPFGLLARLKRPLEYQAIDGEPVDIVFMLLLPAFSQLEQLNALAVVARKLRDQGVLERLRRAANAVELYRAITA
jgi:PTS system nitrogen regulatory IIA component